MANEVAYALGTRACAKGAKNKKAIVSLDLRLLF